MGAWKEVRLLYSAEQKRVFYKDQLGRLFDAATAMPIDNGPADMDTVGINNRLRRALDAALGGLTLMSPDRARRYRAPRAGFKCDEADGLPPVHAAIEDETD